MASTAEKHILMKEIMKLPIETLFSLWERIVQF